MMLTKLFKYLLVLVVSGTVWVTAIAKPPAPEKKVPVMLIGYWNAIDIAKGQVSGTMQVSADGTLSLSPRGYATAKGTWTASNNLLDMDMGALGKSSAGYSFNKNILTLQYEDGVTQKFVKVAEKSASNPPTKK